MPSFSSTPLTFTARTGNAEHVSRASKAAQAASFPPSPPVLVPVSIYCPHTHSWSLYRSTNRTLLLHAAHVHAAPQSFHFPRERETNTGRDARARLSASADSPYFALVERTSMRRGHEEGEREGTVPGVLACLPEVASPASAFVALLCLSCRTTRAIHAPNSSSAGTVEVSAAVCL